jgi:hypothetical protein
MAAMRHHPSTSTSTSTSTVDESSFVETPLIQSKHTVPEGATPSSRFDWRAHITREGARAGMGAGWGRDAKVILDE